LSKGYTINYFIDVLKSAATNKVTKEGVYSVVSPRFGGQSVKANALDGWLNFKTNAIAKGVGQFASYGKTPRARLLTALSKRKKLGTV